MRTHRKALSQHPVIRILVIWVIHALGLIVLTALLSGLHVDDLWIAFAAAGVIGLLNAFLWPLLSYVLLPFAVLTLGLLALVLNGAIIWLTGQIVAGFYVDNLWTAVLAALVAAHAGVCGPAQLFQDALPVELDIGEEVVYGSADAFFISVYRYPLEGRDITATAVSRRGL